MEIKDKFDFLVNRRGGTVLRLGEDKVSNDLNQLFGARAGKVIMVEGHEISPQVRAWVNDPANDGRTLIICGGDGTADTAAEEFINAPAGTNVTMGILPFGTHNLFALELGFASDYHDAALQYNKTVTQQVDVGLVNGMYFLYGLMLDKNSINWFQGRENLRDKKIVDSMRNGFALASGLLSKNKYETLRVSGKGLKAKDLQQNGSVFCITTNALTPRKTPWKMTHLADPMTVIENAFAKEKIDGGELAFYAMKGGLRNVASFSQDIMNGTWDQQGYASVLKSPRFFIDTGSSDKKATVVLDGELKATNYPLDVRILPQVLKVHRPAR